ncbi:MAG: hypothetical protein ACLRFM_01415 [Alphaproteobacteria bacterium]
MRFIFCFCCLCLMSGCSRITNITANKIPEVDTTGDPIYDDQAEAKLLLPWTWFL